MSEMILQKEERVSLALRSLYRRYGYLPYKMSKFEEYDLYVANKQFLVGDGVITFNDTDGRLLALKPDVTLSILKNDLDEGGKRKVYYDESVYRISPRIKQFKEIRQVGLECLGDIGLYDEYEAICLAAESLATISDDYLLVLSHVGLVGGILSELGGEEFAKNARGFLESKNGSALLALGREYGVEEKALATLVNAHGELSVLEALSSLCGGEGSRAAYEKLRSLAALLNKTAYADKLRLDFSVGGDMRYYDDILFKGYIQGVGEGVLSGGRYDKLLSAMDKKSGGIGFAVYLDTLEGFEEQVADMDAEALVLYDDETPVSLVAETVESLVAAGKTVRAQKQKGIRYQSLVDLTGGGV